MYVLGFLFGGLLIEELSRKIQILFLKSTRRPNVEPKANLRKGTCAEYGNFIPDPLES